MRATDPPRMGGVVLEQDQHGGQSCARRQLFGWCLMGVRCDPPGGGLFNFKLSSWPHPRKFGLKRFLTVRKVLAGRWGSLFLGYLLGKHIGGEIAPISFRLTWDGCSSLLPFGGVLSFQSEAREVLSSETAGGHPPDRGRGGALGRFGGGGAARGSRGPACGRRPPPSP